MPLSVYNLRNSINDEKLGGKFDPVDKSKFESSISDAISWLDALQEVRVEAKGVSPTSSCRSCTALQVLVLVASLVVHPAVPWVNSLVEMVLP
jgi:hypothetical protein